jgi:hypothetical protein
MVIKMTTQRYERLDSANDGICIKCGAENSCVEPDAENYECEACEEDAVFGMQQALICGHVEIHDDDDEDSDREDISELH